MDTVAGLGWQSYISAFCQVVSALLLAWRCRSYLHSKMYRTITLSAVLITLSFRVNAHLTKHELTDILTTALNLPTLQQYLHIDSDNSRLPITLVSSELLDEEMIYPIEKFGERIRFLNIGQIRSDNINSYIEVSKLNLRNNICELQIEYSIEGVSVNYKFEKTNEGWNLKESSLWEN